MSHVVKLAAGKSSGGDLVYEEVLVDVVESSRYRLLRSPGLVLGLAADDIIEVTENGKFRTIQRGRNVCIQVLSPTRIDNALEQDASTSITRLGGRLDGRAEKILVYTVPVGVGFPIIEEALNAMIAKHTGLEWYYGNVYDPADGITPLNWW